MTLKVFQGGFSSVDDIALAKTLLIGAGIVAGLCLTVRAAYAFGYLDAWLDAQTTIIKVVSAATVKTDETEITK